MKKPSIIITWKLFKRWFGLTNYEVLAEDLAGMLTIDEPELDSVITDLKRMGKPKFKACFRNVIIIEYLEIMQIYKCMEAIICCGWIFQLKSV